MAKRDLFDDLMQGFDDLEAERTGKITLNTTEIAKPAPIRMTKTQIAQIRKAYNFSQAVFARVLATNVATLRNWEQGRSEPNAQAKLLLKMVENNDAILRAMVELTTGAAAQQARAPRKKANRTYARKRKAAPKKRVSAAA